MNRGRSSEDFLFHESRHQLLANFSPKTILKLFFPPRLVQSFSEFFLKNVINNIYTLYLKKLLELQDLHQEIQ